MAPLRRYVRISRSTVLEMRIHVENPSDIHRWLLRHDDPALLRVIEAIRPLIIPKLREARANDQKSGKKKEIVKDVVQRDEFEVTVYYRASMTPHSVVKRHKVFAGKPEPDKSRGTLDDPLHVEEDGVSPQIRREDSEEDDVVKMEDIPAFPPAINTSGSLTDGPAGVPSTGHEDEPNDQTLNSNPPSSGSAEPDEKKKLGMTASYEGFRVDEHVLILLVTRNNDKSKQPQFGGGHAMMEEWINSTQAAAAMTDD